MTIIELLDKHTPSLTKDDEQEILDMLASGKAFGFEQDVADFAIRTCACGKHVDGFYEYVDHLKQVAT